MGGQVPLKKKKKRFGLFMQQNLLLIFLVFVAIFVALIVRLVFLNYSDGEKYEKRVLSQQTYMSNAISYKRGSILDKNGTVLAESIRVYNLILDPLKMRSDPKYLEPTLDALKKCFAINGDDVKEVLEKKPKSQYVVFQKAIEAKKVELFHKMQEKDENIDGVWFEDDYKRVYPYKSLACDVVGFNTSGMSTGLESYYNDVLTGEDGRQYGYFDSDLNLDRVVKSPTNGNTVVSTIDANVQQIVEKRVAEFNKETGSKNTAVVVMNPQNGGIYAMTSGKQYDLNDPHNLKPFYSEKKLAKMSDEEKLEALNQIWRNFVVSDTYEPGSTFKPITVSAALEEGLVKGKSTFYCPGYHVVHGVRIRCASRVGHGTISLGQSLMYSCNVALMELGEKLGPSRFYKYQTNFMFGSRTGIDLPAETTGYIFKEENLGPVELATSSFGQGFNVSMMQIASAISSIINGGDYYEPHVLKEIRSDQGATIETNQGNIVKKTVSEETSEKVKKYLYDTVENGTATAAQVEGYEIGGKTGTAEKLPRGHGKYLVSFVGFAPAQDPEVLIYVIVDEPGVADQAHSTFASELFQKIAKDIFPFLGVPQTKPVETTSKPDEGKTEGKKEQTKEELKKEESNTEKTSEEEEEITPEGETEETVGDEDGSKQDDVKLPVVDEHNGAGNIVE